MTLFKFLTSKIFFKHLGLAILIGGGLLVLIFLGLKIYTHHGQKLAVPSFYGLELEEAQKLARKSRMRIEVIDSVYYKNRPKGTVIEQNPVPGFFVKARRRIFIVTNAFNPEKVKMPNVIGVSHRQAKAILKNRGLEVGKLIHVPDMAINNVLKQKIDDKDIAPGELVEKGSKIDLVLGKGLSNQTILLPNLEENTLAEAKDKLLRAALNLGAVIYDESIQTATDSFTARVWRQYPIYKQNRRIQLGSSVDLWLSVDSAKFMKDTILLNEIIE